MFFVFIELSKFDALKLQSGKKQKSAGKTKSSDKTNSHLIQQAKINLATKHYSVHDTVVLSWQRSSIHETGK